MVLAMEILQLPTASTKSALHRLPYNSLRTWIWVFNRSEMVAVLGPFEALPYYIHTYIHTIRPKVRRSVCLEIKHTSGAYGQIVITYRQLRVCWCGALSLTRRRNCCLQLLLVLASEIILRSESRRTREHILMSQIRDPFSSFPTTHKATVEVFDPASTRDSLNLQTNLVCNISARTA
jgi:hypothetical protein